MPKFNIIDGHWFSPDYGKYVAKAKEGNKIIWHAAKRVVVEIIVIAFIGGQMEKFCFNPECMMHKYEGNKYVHSLYVEENGMRRRIEHHVYSDRNGKVIFLCSICHTACQLLIKR